MRQHHIDKKLVRMRFDRHAREYDDYAEVQKQMAGKTLDSVERARRGNSPLKGHPKKGYGSRLPVDEIPETDRIAPPPINRILEVGSGTGLLTEMLLRQYPEARVTAIDISEAMIVQAKAKIGEAADRVTFVAADAESLPFDADEHFDLIVSSATFQWFNEPKRTAGALMKMLARGGMLAFSTFLPGTFDELHTSFRAVEQTLGVPSRPRGQAFLAGEQWSEIFVPGGGLQSGMFGGSWSWEEEKRVFTYSSVREFLDHVKRIGASNAVAIDDAGLGGRKLFKEMERFYAQHYGARVESDQCRTQNDEIGSESGQQNNQQRASGSGGQAIHATYAIGYGLFQID